MRRGLVIALLAIWLLLAACWGGTGEGPTTAIPCVFCLCHTQEEGWYPCYRPNPSPGCEVPNRPGAACCWTMPGQR